MNICRRGDELVATAGCEVDATCLRLEGSSHSIRTRGINQSLRVWQELRRALMLANKANVLKRYKAGDLSCQDVAVIHLEVKSSSCSRAASAKCELALLWCLWC